MFLFGPEISGEYYGKVHHYNMISMLYNQKTFELEKYVSKDKINKLTQYILSFEQFKLEKNLNSIREETKNFTR
jgi:hypothetical protein